MPSSPGPDVVRRLRAAGCVFAEDEAALLLGATDDPVTLEDLLARRVAGEPLEHLLGRVEFAGLSLVVTAGVFVPRRRTEHLADLAVAAAAERARPVLVDLCCGCGAIGAVLTARVPGARVLAADLDPVAVAAARLNLPTAEVSTGDLYAALPSALRGHVDVLAVNAPYVPTARIADMPPEAREHEPHLALDGGADGLDVHRRVAADALGWLTPGGVLLIEVAREQRPSAAQVLVAAGLDVVAVTDAERDALVLRGRAPRPR